MARSVARRGADDVFIWVISYSIDGAVVTSVAPEKGHGVRFGIHFPNPGSVIRTPGDENVRLPFVRTPTNIPDNISFHKNHTPALLVRNSFGDLRTRLDISKEKAISLNRISSVQLQ